MVFTTIDDFYVSHDALLNSPSKQDGVSYEVEVQLRRYGCQLIQEAGILLKYGQIVMATAQVLFHRFYCKKSMVKCEVKDVAAGCLFTASKLEEELRQCRELIAVFYRLDRRSKGKSLVPLDIYGKEFERLKQNLFKVERYIMKTFGFIMHIDHPHKLVLNYLQFITNKQAGEDLMKVVWGMTNDSLRTTLCVTFRAEVVACGIIFYAARRMQVPLPESPPWWALFGVSKLQLLRVCEVMQQLYDAPVAQHIDVAPKVQKPGMTTPTREGQQRSPISLAAVTPTRSVLPENDGDAGPAASVPASVPVSNRESNGSLEQGDPRSDGRGRPKAEGQQGEVNSNRRKERDKDGLPRSRSLERRRSRSRDRRRSRSRERDRKDRRRSRSRSRDRQRDDRDRERRAGRDDRDVRRDRDRDERDRRDERYERRDDDKRKVVRAESRADSKRTRY